jgi:hypothetical protein
MNGKYSIELCKESGEGAGIEEIHARTYGGWGFCFWWLRPFFLFGSLRGEQGEL